MNDITYVGLDVHKARVCVAIAENGRGGEVRQVGIFEIWASPFADRFGARLRRGGTIADSDEGGRPGQDRSP